MLNILEDFEFLQRVDLKEFGEALMEAGVVPTGETIEDFMKPFDYEKVFKPMSVTELRTIMGTPPPVGSEEDRHDNKGKKEGDSQKTRGIADLV